MIEHAERFATNYKALSEYLTNTAGKVLPPVTAGDRPGKEYDDTRRLIVYHLRTAARLAREIAQRAERQKLTL